MFSKITSKPATSLVSLSAALGLLLSTDCSTRTSSIKEQANAQAAANKLAANMSPQMKLMLDIAATGIVTDLNADTKGRVEPKQRGYGEQKFTSVRESVDFFVALQQQLHTDPKTMLDYLGAKISELSAGNYLLKQPVDRDKEWPNDVAAIRGMGVYFSVLSKKNPKNVMYLFLTPSQTEPVTECIRSSWFKGF